MGYDSFHLNRIDYEDMAARTASRTLQLIWRGSDLDTTPAKSIWTNVMDGYNFPWGFCYEQSFVEGSTYCADPPIMDDPLLEDNNVKDRVDTFLAYVDGAVFPRIYEPTFLHVSSI